MYKFLILFLLIISSSLADKKPNIVFLLVDDLGWGDFSCYGSKFHETPNIDRLAADGMKFTNGYAACTVCSPSRAAILTGRYPGRTNLTDWIPGKVLRNAPLGVPKWKKYMDHERFLLPEAFKEAGYKTQFIGKWHLQPVKSHDNEDAEKHWPEQHGFDNNIAGFSAGFPLSKNYYFFPWDNMPGMKDVGKEGDYLTDVLTDKAVNFIEENKDNPFLLYFSYYTLHSPVLAKEDYVAKYEQKQKSGSYQGKNPVYAGMAQSLDESVGRVIATLKRLKLAENTIIILTGDNGGNEHDFCGGLKGRKGLSYEGGVRQPLIVKYPSVIKAGTVSDIGAIGMDFYPTLLELAGLPLKEEEHKDGVSLVPVLTQKGTIKKRALYWHYPHYHRTKPYGSIVYDGFKLIEFFEDGTLELYNLKDDPKEEKNILESQPEIAANLMKMMKSWRKDVEAQIPPKNSEYDPGKPTGKPPRKKKK